MDQFESEEIHEEDELSEKKKWLFRENIRLAELQKQLDEQQKQLDEQKQLLKKQQRKQEVLKKQLENQKRLFDKEWQILERETRRLAIDKEQFQREKHVYRDKIAREVRKNMPSISGVKIFFKGIDGLEPLKKRYKALLKIYHPDNLGGDTHLIQAINLEYEEMKKLYQKNR